MQLFNWVDGFIIGIILISVLISFVRGFVREALSLVGWILAFWVSLNFCQLLAERLQPYINHATLRIAAAFCLLFIATLIIMALINFLIAQLVRKTGLSGTDRVLGMGFGFIRGVLLVALVILLGELTPLPAQHMWKESRLVPTFAPVEDWLTRFLPDDYTASVHRQQTV